MSERVNKKENGKEGGFVATKVLLRIWSVFFTVFKIALGAVATVALIVLVCGFVLAGSLGDYLENDILPNADLVLEDYEMDAPSYAYFVNENGQIEEMQKLHASLDWRHAGIEEIPDNLIYAAVAIEDKRFFEHQGVDWFTTIKAFANMFFGNTTVGGSSITQQLIKNRTGADSVTVQRKVLEFFQATAVERSNNKDTIMELYLNSIYLGQGCRGVRSAAETYFGKELQMLTLGECASLISITNNPSLFDPYSDSTFRYEGKLMDGMQRNRHRQRLVLMEMLNQGYITRAEYDEALAQELVLKNGIDPEDKWTVCDSCGYEGIAATYGGTASELSCPKCSNVIYVEQDNSQEVYSYFLDTVLEDVGKDLAKKDGIDEWNDDIWKTYMDKISRGGYHIYTTYDPSVQAQVDRIYQDLDQIPYTRSAQQLQSAIVVVDVRTGDIVAMSGGVGTAKEHFGLNRATQSKLQSGSSIKPLSIYAAGFQQGTISPATVIKDLPMTYEGGAWPKNDNRSYSYSRTIYSGITSSVNAVAANTLNLIGDTYGFNFAKESFGLSTLRAPEDLNFASLAMGAQYNGVTVRDMSVAFATFANGGVWREGRTYTKVYDSKGNVVLDNTQDARQILSEKANTYMNYCLVNAANHGTGTGAIFSGMQIAGKTGTTSSSRDRWFCGYTGYYAAAVWCGYDMPEVINLGYNPASNLWYKVMKPLHSGLENKKLYSTDKMSYVSVCLDSGRLATSACSSDVRGSRATSVLCYPEDRPGNSCHMHTLVEYCTDGEGVANEYCKLFAQVDPNVKIASRALVKLTPGKYNEIRSAMGAGLSATYYRDDYVYLIDGNGNDASFKGFRGNINANITAPYKVCDKHTRKTWDDYQASQATQPTEPVEPTPTVPAAG